MTRYQIIFISTLVTATFIAVPKCYDVPKVECFHVLSPAPDLACAPRAVQECMDTVKEVPYLYPQEKCYDVPREECRDITEQVLYLYLQISTYLHIPISTYLHGSGPRGGVHPDRPDQGAQGHPRQQTIRQVRRFY